ncbi:endonuclease III [Candidatus Neoehrlichia procyonis]|uniref:Endonuclease III n=1 Tax=Candidatus Neoehrlichia procyonis str. RAC413 TaxID=1359163 RepID=A0A0F3NNM0_9RICK|nr:endonuclease III [Candidatus Neoehrlichia lotoris]KJV69645.1 endonuclease III [Candidatus Neoehrlichia lotoris str. RAC413]
MNKQKINLIFKRFQHNNPAPKIELKYYSEFTLLVAIVLSARTTDVSVNKVTERLFKVADTPEQILSLGEDGLKAYINTIGLYNTKSKNIIKMSEVIMQKYDAQVPHDFDILTSLPGVGRKSANVFLNSMLGVATIAVDTHVFRVSNRIGLVKANNVLDVEKHLMCIIPKKWLLYAHHWLVLHGRYICKARYPLCHKCIIEDLCYKNI